ncbi:MAG: hypothetical protein AB1736_02610 [Chloroflexota bacterium]
MAWNLRSWRQALACGSALVVMLGACSSNPSIAASGPGTSGVPPRTQAPASVAAVATPGQTPGGAISVYQLSEGPWAEGTIHVEVRGGHQVDLDLPFSSGDTAAGRTTITYERLDPADSRWSPGLVRLSFFFQADSIGIESGGLVVQGPCTYAFIEVTEGSLSGDLACADDLQATVQGDPREITITGSFSGGR